jgi:N utilization substance protein B
MSSFAKQKAREHAFLILYRWDLRGDKIKELVKEYLDERNPSNEKVMSYMRKLVDNTIEHIVEIDKIIDEHLEDWSFDRLGYVERNLLRLGVAELLFLERPRRKDFIAGYASLARKYADEKARRFVNGVLMGIRKSRMATSSRKE